MSPMSHSLLPVADAHVHFWDLALHRHPWLMVPEPEGPFGKTAAIRHTYLLADYVADARHQNVQRLVHVETGWDPSDPMGEMRWIQAVADKHGAPHAHIAHVDLASAEAGDLVRAHARFPLFRGVRDRLLAGDFTRGDTSQSRIDHPDWRRGLGLLEPGGWVFDLQAPWTLHGRAANLARDFPGIGFVLTHAGYPPAPNDSDFSRWRDGIEVLARQPNVAIKLSGLMLAEKAWVPEHAQQVLNLLLASFGVDRVLAASNFPVDRLFAPLDELFGQYRAWLSQQTMAAQRKILHSNACRIYRMAELGDVE